MIRRSLVPNDSKTKSHRFLPLLRRSRGSLSKSSVASSAFSRTWRGARAIALFLLLLSFASPLSARSGLKTAIVGIHAPEELRARAAQITPKLRDAFRASSVFSPLTEEQTVRILTEKHEALLDALYVTPSRELIQEARDYSIQAEFDKSLAALDQAEAYLLYFREHLTSIEELIEIQLLKTRMYYGLGQPERAEGALERLAVLAPERALDPAAFPREALERHQQLIDSKRSSSNIRIHSNPSGAKVYLDGVDVGESPVTIHNLSIGLHFLHLEASSGIMAYQDLEVGPVDSSDVSLRLEAPALKTSPPSSLHEMSEQEALAAAYRALAGKLGLKIIPLVQLDESGVELQLLEPGGGTVSVSYYVAVDPEESRIGSRLRGLVGQVASSVTEDGQIIRLGRLMEGPTLRNNSLLSDFFFPSRALLDFSRFSTASSGSQANYASRPFYRKAWFWAVVGGSAALTAGGLGFAYYEAENSAADSAGIKFNLPTP